MSRAIWRWRTSSATSDAGLFCYSRVMSFRFRLKLGPLVYDEKLGGAGDPRPARLTRADLAVLALASVMLLIMLAGAIWG
jgi:hypothetical protein